MSEVWRRAVVASPELLDGTGRPFLSSRYGLGLQDMRLHIVKRSEQVAMPVINMSQR